MAAEQPIVRRALKKKITLDDIDGKRLTYVFLGGQETKKLIVRLTDNKYIDKFIATLGYDHKDVDLIFDKETYEMESHQLHRLQLWDNTNNNGSKWRNTDSFHAPKMGYIIGIDLNDSDSIKNAREHFRELEKYGDEQAKEEIILVGIDNSTNPSITNEGNQQRAITFGNNQQVMLYHDSPMLASSKKIPYSDIESLANEKTIAKENILMVSASTGENCTNLLSRLGTISIEAHLAGKDLQDDNSVVITAPGTRTVNYDKKCLIM